MEKRTIEQLNDQSLIDLRSQYDYQTGHLKNSLNLNPKNFKKYANDYFTSDQSLVFVVGNEELDELEEVYAAAKDMEFKHIDGYILADEWTNEEVEKTETIPAKDFLSKKDDYILLDVRHPDEITRPAPEKNLVNIPLEDLSTAYENLDSTKTIYTLCGSGNRGTSAASYLTNKGFKAAVVEGGMKAIQEERAK